MIYNNIKIQQLRLEKKQSPNMREALSVSSELCDTFSITFQFKTRKKKKRTLNGFIG